METPDGLPREPQPLEPAGPQALDPTAILESVLRQGEDGVPARAKINHATFDTRLRKKVGQLWDDPTRPSAEAVSEALNGAIFVDFTDNLTDRAACMAGVNQELASRHEQRRYFERLATMIDEAHTPEDMVAITQAYSFLRWHAGGQEGPSKGSNYLPLPYNRYLDLMFQRAADLLYDEATDTASPDELVDFMLPAVQTFLQDPYLTERFAQADPPRPATDFIKVGGPYGSADWVARGRLVDRLILQGYPDLKPPRGTRIYTGQHYITASTLEVLNELQVTEGKLDSNLKTGSLERANKVMVSTLEQLAEVNEEAAKLLAKYHELSVSVPRDPRAHEYLLQVVALVNLQANEFNKQNNLQGDQRLRPLGRNLQSVFLAFGRLLYMIDPDLYSLAAQGSVLDEDHRQDDPFNLTAKMRFLEALATLRQEHEAATAPEPVQQGDLRLRLRALGFSDDIADEVISSGLVAGHTEGTIHAYRNLHQQYSLPRRRRVYVKRKGGLMS